jgi:hypothetical protein
MIEELSIVARARMQLINGAGPRPSRKPRRSLRQVIARVASRLGGQMVSIGRRLECYEVNLLSDTDGLRSAKAQIN